MGFSDYLSGKPSLRERLIPVQNKMVEMILIKRNTNLKFDLLG